MIFTIKVYSKWILLLKFIRNKNDFYYKNIFEMDFTIKID